MPRVSDRERFLRCLLDTGGLSNMRLRAELNLADDRYSVVRQELLDEGLVQKYRAQHGGIRLTARGEKSVSKPLETPPSSVKRETDLYDPLVACLERQSVEDETNTIALNTGALRVKGKWQNPDVTLIALDLYQYLQKLEVIVTTYEVKQWGGWNVEVVFEAASHRRFSHESIVVLEWAKGVEFSVSDKAYRMDQISRECQRFGVGLCTLTPHYGSYRLDFHIDPERHTPAEADVEAWLEYVFERQPAKLDAYRKALDLANKTLNQQLGEPG